MTRVSIVSFSAFNVIFVAHTFISCEIAFIIFDGTLANCNAFLSNRVGRNQRLFYSQTTS